MATTDTVIEHEIQEEQDLWSGGKQPFKASYGKLMMWYFLLSDAFTFAGFLIAYGALRFSSPTWPVPDFVFSTAPFGIHHAPLIFVTIMSFLLIVSSVTMVRAVQEGHRENKNGVVFWMLLTVLGGAGFLMCQAWEWTNLIGTEHMTVTTNPFGTHTEDGVYLNADGSESDETFKAGESYLLHKAAGGGHGEGHDEGPHYETEVGDYAGYAVNEKGFVLRKFKVTEGEDQGIVKAEALGPAAFGALFFFITGFHGFHVFSGVMFLLIILINAASGLYVKRKNGYEMVEKIGLYWHFVDLVWVFVFLVFYLL
ncbi:cytochrome c oxidase subunit 3 [Flavilitoribacter nigricans]|uniref:Cytochrome oxidase subunit III n=1 Tax=Flavilitoribacter nigricans (strain ATCC 23147 / DSM 23189 / NBRC 102662 / NCIMB 1420 / SS-2) TaxID=1122177 RepID=A0A2D0NA29_FLAN2|nr:cytochrome c oxidase subunit 3 [Flavilitoribacter nigricans]PHN05009.1 cytochrome oxidase subunit III [Flavilitoribacter nigricans DSM 23189 = NBRC 102662]